MKDVLIFGINDFAQMLYENIQYQSRKEFRVLGFVLDDSYWTNKQCCGLEVFPYSRVMETSLVRDIFLSQTSHTENIPYALINQLELNVESHSRTLLCTQTTHPKSGQIVQESFQERFDQQDF